MHMQETPKQHHELRETMRLIARFDAVRAPCHTPACDGPAHIVTIGRLHLCVCQSCAGHWAVAPPGESDAVPQS
jgi:hypothetical protein